MPWWYKTCQLRRYTYSRVKQSSRETNKNLMKFLELTRVPHVIHTDDSLEFGKSLRGVILESLYVNTTQIRNKWDAERAVRRVKEGTSAVLLQSGLGNEWRADSVECYCYLRNFQDFLEDGRTLYERRFGEPLKGPTILFGSSDFCKRPFKTPPIW